MDVTPLIRQDQQIIQSYAGGVFKVSGVTYPHAVLIAPSKTVAWDTVSKFEVLTFEDFRPLLNQANDIDVVLLGCGPVMQFFNPDLKAKLSAQGIVVDVMDTGAACRTYNVLMAEGRRVVAALLPAKS